MAESSKNEPASYTITAGWVSLAIAAGILYIVWTGPHKRAPEVESFLRDPSFEGLFIVFAYLAGANIFTLVPLAIGLFAHFKKKHPKGITIFALSVVVFAGISVRQLTPSTNARTTQAPQQQNQSNLAESEGTATAVLGSASHNFATLELPNGVLVDLPRNWMTLSNNHRITIDTAVESKLDLSQIDKRNPSDLGFAANYYDDTGKTAGILNIRYYPAIVATQSDAENAGPAGIHELDEGIREGLSKTEAAFGMKILSWNGTQKESINGLTAFVSDYRRQSLNGHDAFRVRLVRILAGTRSFTMTISYREPDEYLLQPICDRIILSIRMTR